MATKALPWNTRSSSGRGVELMGSSVTPVNSPPESPLARNNNNRTFANNNNNNSIPATIAPPPTTIRIIDPKQQQPTITQAPDLEICMEDHDSASGLTTTQDELPNLDVPASHRGLSNTQFTLKVDLPDMERIPCSCCFFLGYETCCAIYSGIGCISFIAAITCLCLYLSGSLSRYS